MKDWIRRGQLHKSEEQPLFVRNHSYQRFFEGFSLRERFTESGEPITVTQYTGDYYYPSESAQDFLKYKLIISTWYLLSVSSLLCGFFSDQLWKTVLFSGIAQALGIGTQLYLMHSMLAYWMCEFPMTVGSYRTAHQPLKRSSFCCCISSLILVTTQFYGAASLLSVICYGVSFLSCLILYTLERKHKYEIRSAEEETSET